MDANNRDQKIDSSSMPTEIEGKTVVQKDTAGTVINAPHEGTQLADDDPAGTNVHDVARTTAAPNALAGASDLTGKLIDNRYQIEKELGRGGIGVVYLALDKKIGKHVVVKILLESSLRSEMAVRKFKQEAEALARLDQHPGIVGILDVGELPEGQPYLVMQFVNGVMLRDEMRAEGMDIERAVNLMGQVCDALDSAHQKGVYHRDLKPENIMVQQPGSAREQVKIIDFGVAKVRDSQVAQSTEVATTVGTVLYMSPEQLCGEKLTPASEVYALGVIAYELLTGRRPFNPETKYQLLEMQRQGVRVPAHDLRPALPADSTRVLANALAFESKQRYQSALQFADELGKALTGDAPEHHSLNTVANAAPVNTQPAFQPLAGMPLAATAAPVAVAAPPAVTQAAPRNFVSYIAAALVLFVIVGIGGWFLYTRFAKPESSLTERSLTYSLTVQKIRDGQNFETPFESSGQEIYEDGYKFRLNFNSPQSGYLYLLNAGPDDSGGTGYVVLYPINNNSAQLAAQTRAQTGWYVFGGNRGTENFWIVWSSEPVKELEAVKGLANSTDLGKIKDPAQKKSVEDFLQARQTASKPETAPETGREATIVKGRGEALAYLLPLKHR